MILISKDYKIILSLLIFVLIGFFFIGRGITGKVISQTCCVPPNCDDEEDICDFYREEFKSPSDFSKTDLYIGTIILLISMIIYLLLHRRTN